MPEIDDELVARTIDWCAEAGRLATAEQIRGELSGLTWDELLALRALLADPPPSGPLGRLPLGDLARAGVSDGVAGRAPPTPDRTRTPAEGSARRAGVKRKERRGAAGPVIRRARDRVVSGPSEASPAPLPLVDELSSSEGRATLERLVRRHGAQRGRILAALASGWRRADGTPPDLADLAALLEAHGLTRSFERRERNELLHALRAAGGLKKGAARAVGVDGEAFDAALDRLGAMPEAEAIRAVHRDELRRRATLSERVRLLLGEQERLEDLGLLAEVEADLRDRLPHHLRALEASRTEPVAMALARSLAVTPRDVGALAARFGLDLGERRPPARAPSPHRERPSRPRGPAGADRRRQVRGRPKRR